MTTKKFTIGIIAAGLAWLALAALAPSPADARGLSSPLVVTYSLI